MATRINYETAQGCPLERRIPDAAHDRLFDEADIVTATGHQYTKACMFRRNWYLIDDADMLLAAYHRQGEFCYKQIVDFLGRKGVSMDKKYGKVCTMLFVMV